MKAVSIDPMYMDVNGTSVIPELAFGVHQIELTEELVKRYGITAIRYNSSEFDKLPIPGQVFTDNSSHGEGPEHTVSHQYYVPANVGHIIYCLGDRYQPAFPLYLDWDTKLLETCDDICSQAMKSKAKYDFELWNEPNINWACKPGVNFDERFYDPTPTVSLHGIELPNLQWKPGRKAKNVETGNVSYLATRWANGEWLGSSEIIPTGQEFQFRNKRYKVVPCRWVYDTEQPNWWSGKQNLQFYLQMLDVLVPAFEMSGTGINVLAGWGFDILDTSLDRWKSLYKPLVDTGYSIKINEHHYGVPPRAITGAMEILGKFGYKMAITECGGTFKNGAAAPIDWGSTDEDLHGTYAYNITDIITTLSRSPDKLYCRLVHRPDKFRGGLVALEMLRPIRGKLLHTILDDGLLMVGSYDSGHATYAFLNDTDYGQEIKVATKSPHAIIRSMREGEIVNSEVNGDQISILLEPHQAVCITIECTPNGRIKRETNYGSVVVQMIKQGFEDHIEIQDPSSVTDAYLRFSGYYTSKVRGVTINGVYYTCQPRLDTVVRIDPAILKESNIVAYDCDGEVMLHHHSLIVDRISSAR